MYNPWILSIPMRWSNNTMHAKKKIYPIVTKYLFDIVVLVFLKKLLWNILKYFFIFLIQAIQNHKKYYKIYF
jgi:hypothetical protein